MHINITRSIFLQVKKKIHNEKRKRFVLVLRVSGKVIPDVGLFISVFLVKGNCPLFKLNKTAFGRLGNEFLQEKKERGREREGWRGRETEREGEGQRGRGREKEIYSVRARERERKGEGKGGRERGREMQKKRSFEHFAEVWKEKDVKKERKNK